MTVYRFTTYAGRRWTTSSNPVTIVTLAAAPSISLLMPRVFSG
jgi:hypothetical protein